LLAQNLNTVNSLYRNIADVIERLSNESVNIRQIYVDISGTVLRNKELLQQVLTL